MEESLALYTRSRVAWNEWANSMIAEREALETTGDWVAGYDSDIWNDATRNWHAAARADFSAHLLRDNVDFKDFLFPGDAWFGSATFSGDARFDGATFKGRTLFDTAKFEKEANFNAMRGGASFSLAEFRFCGVPNFIEANLNEAPRLDNLHIEPARVAPLSLKRVRDYFKGNPDLPARWRALKRLAVQEHDHEQELVFFRSKLRSRRLAVDNIWQPVS
jgi:hypothetical protein